jgi:hypothetical protein
MPITISLSPLNVDSSANNFVYAVATLAFSGTYPTGGDTIDFTTVADKLPSTQIIQAFAESQNGNSGYYVAVAGTALNNWKLKAFQRRRHGDHRRRVPRQCNLRRSAASHHRPQAAVIICGADASVP